MRKRKLIYAIVTVLAFVGFNSCIDDPEEPEFDVVTDVFIQKSVDNGVEKYGLNFWAFGNKTLKSVTVDGPGEEAWTLTQDPNNQYVYSRYPEITQYTTSMPASGNYTFTATSTQNNDNPVIKTDNLENIELAAIEIDTTEFTTGRLKVSWTAVANADAYLIRLVNQSGTRIFISPTLTSSTKNFAFGISDEGWGNMANKAEPGKNYQVELLAILFESSSTLSNQEYNIQFISLDSRDIVWGE